MDRRLEPCTFGQGLNPLNNKFSILCTVMNSSRFMNSSEQYRFMNSDRYFGKYWKKSVKTRYIAEISPKKPIKSRNFAGPTIGREYHVEMRRYTKYRRNIGRYFRFFKPCQKVHKRRTRTISLSPIPQPSQKPHQRI